LVPNEPKLDPIDPKLDPIDPRFDPNVARFVKNDPPLLERSSTVPRHAPPTREKER
jgi:hypothetical protein